MKKSFLSLVCAIALWSCEPLASPLSFPLINVVGEEMGKNIPCSSLPFDFNNSDFNTKELITAIDRSIAWYLAPSNKTAIFRYGDVNYTAQEMVQSYELFKTVLKSENFQENFEKNFTVYSSLNTKGKGLITGYYAPLLKGCLTPTKTCSIPLYPRPRDLITTDLGPFIPQMGGKSITGRFEKGKFIPYYTRAEIENGLLKEKPILYLESKIDAYFLQVQGSGVVDVGNGKKVNVGYGGGNGHPYVSAGKVMLDMGLIPSGKISMQAIRETLKNNPDKIDEVFNKNPNFVFFRLYEGGPYGNIGQTLTPKLSVAMDNGLIPKGGLVFIKTTLPPKPDSNLSVVERSNRVPFSSFMVVQDTGGAIRGGGRVDMYMGEGDVAEYYAGQMAEEGSVYLIVAKKEALFPRRVSR